MKTKTLLIGLGILSVVADALAATFYVNLNHPSPISPYTNWASAATNIQDAVDIAVAGDEIIVTNGVYAAGGRAVYGTLTNRLAVTKPVTVRSLNGPQVTLIQGRRVPGTTNGDGAIRCVYLTNGAMLSGFTLTNGATRSQGDFIWEQNGGGVWCESRLAMLSDCTLAGNSANLNGGGAFLATLNHCALLGNSAGNHGGGAEGGILNDCTLTGNSASYYGGGVYSGTLSNCTLIGNTAYSGGGTYSGMLNRCFLAGNSAHDGGGANQSWLDNCTLAGNLAFAHGGGASSGTLNNCTLTGNSADAGGGAESGVLNNCTLTRNSANKGGGVFWGTLKNCIVYSNTATNDGANYYEDQYSGVLNFSCTTPLPQSGLGNITNAPLFVDTNGWSNLRLQSNSPCINAGNNTYASGSTDLDGRPRIVSGSVDIGAFEFQGPGMSEFIGWLWQYGLPTDGSSDATDSDQDGRNNWQEWRCGTDPTNAFSALRLLQPVPSGTNWAVSWQSVAGVSYALEWSTNLSAVPAFQLLAPNLPGQTNITTFIHPNGATTSPRFYRISVP